MTRDKLFDCMEASYYKYVPDTPIIPTSKKEWDEAKRKLEAYIKEMDEAIQVYQMENNKK